jgi:hypothetical protein
MYFAHISQTGPVKYGQVPDSIGVLEAIDKPMPIGDASCKTWDKNGVRCGNCGSGGSLSRGDG